MNDEFPLPELSEQAAANPKLFAKWWLERNGLVSDADIARERNGLVSDADIARELEDMAERDTCIHAIRMIREELQGREQQRSERCAWLRSQWSSLCRRLAASNGGRPALALVVDNVRLSTWHDYDGTPQPA